MGSALRGNNYRLDILFCQRVDRFFKSNTISGFSTWIGFWVRKSLDKQKYSFDKVYPNTSVVFERSVRIVAPPNWSLTF